VRHVRTGSNQDVDGPLAVGPLAVGPLAVGPRAVGPLEDKILSRPQLDVGMKRATVVGLVIDE